MKGQILPPKPVGFVYTVGDIQQAANNGQLSQLKEKGVNLDVDGGSVLKQAIFNATPEILQAYLDAGADPLYISPSGVTYIHFAQADILELADYPEKFDLIECVGVLHHMQDPLQGWKILRNLLKPQGWMLIGLYSQLGRQDVQAAKDLIKTQDIRTARQTILNLPHDHPAYNLTYSIDFYTTSTARDLLFHTHEQAFTLPEIESILHELHLSFSHFTLRNPATLSQYHSLYPDDPPQGTLPHWHLFEQAHPWTFAGMYQFSCRAMMKL